MNLPQYITILYNDTNFVCDSIPIAFRSKYLKNQILKSLIPVIEIRGIWEVEDMRLFFIEFCQNGKTDFINSANALRFRAIASNFESDLLIQATNEYYEQISPHEELRELLNCIQVYNTNPTLYEESVSFHLSTILSDESDFNLMLTVPLTSLFRIFSGKHNENIDPNTSAKFILKIIEKYGKCSEFFLKFIRIPNLSSQLLIELKDAFEKNGFGSIEDCESILKARQEIDDQKAKIESLSATIKEKDDQIEAKMEEIEKMKIKTTEISSELTSFKESMKPSIDLLNLYLKTIPIIPDIPFSFVFVAPNGTEQAISVTNIRHFGVGYALTACPYNPKDPNQLFYFRPTKKNTIESAKYPDQMLDDNHGVNYTDGTILYVHPPNGFTNQQWNYIDDRIITVRTKNAVTFVPDLFNHPFRLYPIDDQKLQKFSIKYSADDQSFFDC